MHPLYFCPTLPTLRAFFVYAVCFAYVDSYKRTYTERLISCVTRPLCLNQTFTVQTFFNQTATRK